MDPGSRLRRVRDDEVAITRRPGAERSEEPGTHFAFWQVSASGQDQAVTMDPGSRLRRVQDDEVCNNPVVLGPSAARNPGPILLFGKFPFPGRIRH